MDRGKFFQLDCHYVDYDGKTYGEASVVSKLMNSEEQEEPIVLGHSHLVYRENEADVRGRLIGRGRRLRS